MADHIVNQFRKTLDYQDIPNQTNNNKILDQLQDPRKEVIQLLNKGRTANKGQTANLTCATTKRANNCVLTIICQLLKSLSAYPIAGSIADPQNTKLQGKLNYLKDVLKRRRDSQYSHKMF